jgi:hypothetical protein
MLHYEPSCRIYTFSAGHAVYEWSVEGAKPDGEREASNMRAICEHNLLLYVSSYCYICVLMLLCMCPHTAMYVSSYFYICALILVYMFLIYQV